MLTGTFEPLVRDRKEQATLQNSASAADGLDRCPICGQTGRFCFTAGQTPVLECADCLHRFAGIATAPDHVQRHYGDDYFFAGGAGYSDYLSSEPLVRKQTQWYIDRVARYGIQPSDFAQAGQRPRLFAVGTAAGFDLAQWREAGWDVAGIEPNETMATYARQTLGLNVTTASLETLQPQKPYEMVTAMQVMGHFANPRLAAERLGRLVRPGGWLLVETWDYRSLTARCWGRCWHEYSPPTVLQWFSRQSLQRLLAPLGLQAMAVGRPVKRIGGTHARGLLEYKLSQWPLSTLTTGLLRLVPRHGTFRYPGNDVFWMLFSKTGKQTPSFADSVPSSDLIPLGPTPLPVTCSQTIAD